MPSSKLSRLANGPNRLWMFGGGIMAVFVGLMLSPTPPSLRRAVVDSWDEATYDADDEHDQAVAVLEPVDEHFEPAETKALLELLETDEAVDGAAAAMMEEMSLFPAEDVAVEEPESESLDSFELAPQMTVAATMAPTDKFDEEQSSGEERGAALSEQQNVEPDDDESVGGCLTIAEDQAADDDATNVLQREVDEYAGIEGDDGYVCEDVDGDADCDTPEADDEDESDDEDDDSNTSFGSNPFRR